MSIRPTFAPDPEVGIFQRRNGDPITLSAHDAFNETTEEMERTIFATFEDGLHVSIYATEVAWTPCDCGWQYPPAILRQASECRITLDPNPTHRCVFS